MQHQDLQLERLLFYQSKPICFYYSVDVGNEQLSMQKIRLI